MPLHPRTHFGIEPRWSGAPVELAPGRARLLLPTQPEMVADAVGLVHGGFVFALADHAAMLAVNEPTVVLVSAEVAFLRPVVVGDVLAAEAEVSGVQGKRHQVIVRVLRGEEEVFSGTFSCAVPKQHVLAPRSDEAGRTGGR